MGCKFPEHHGGGGLGDIGAKGGSWWPLGAAVALAMLFAPVILVIIHVAMMVLEVVAGVVVFTAIAAAAVGVRQWMLWWRNRGQRQIPVQYRPQMQTPRWRSLPPEQRRRPVLLHDETQQLTQQGGHQLHLNLGGASPEVVREVFRQIRGS